MFATIKVKTHGMRILPILAAMMALLAMTAACERHGTDGGDSDRLRTHRLRQIDDSVVRLAPSALPSIMRGMANATDSLSYYEYYLRLTCYYWLSDKPERADSCIRRIERFCQRQLDGNGCDDTESRERVNALLAGALSCKAAVNHNFHRDEKGTVRLYHEVLRLLTESNRKDELPKTCANMADAYIQCNDIPEAARWYRRALFLVDSLRLPERENITLYMGLAQIYLTLGDNDNALKYYKATEKHMADMTPSMQAYYLCNFGNFYYFTHNYRQSLAMFLRMKRLLEGHGMQNNFDMYLCKVNLADVYLNMDSTERARECLDDAEPFFRRMGDATAIYYCNTIRIGLAVHEAKYTEVERIVQTESRQQRESVPYNMVTIRNKYIMGYYEATHNYAMAYATLREDIKYNDSLEHNRSNMRSAEIMARFRNDTLQLHHELALEHKNATIQRTTMLAAAVLAAAVIMGLVTLAWTLHLRKRRFEDQMNIVNLKLVNMRNRISPHFVFNVINNKIISSDNKEATELTALTRLIRANLDMSMQACITLESEVEYLKKYVEVERYLLGDDFCFTLNIDSDVRLGSIYVPSMFLQILTENAIVHGLRGWEGHKQLDISIRREPVSPDTADGKAMQTVICVADNGPGFNLGGVKKNTGLSVITQTIAITNERNRNKMRFEIHNIAGSDGHTKGCKAVLKVPDGIKF